MNNTNIAFKYSLLPVTTFEAMQYFHKTEEILTLATAA